MRIARRYAIRDSGIFHKMWRGHNREHVLASRTDKLSYLNYLRITLTTAIASFVEEGGTAFLTLVCSCPVSHLGMERLCDSLERDYRSQVTQEGSPGGFRSILVCEP